MKKLNILILVLTLFYADGAIARNALTLEESIKLALKNNNEVRNAELEIEAAQQLKKAARKK